MKGETWKRTLVVGERNHAAGRSDVVGSGEHVHVVLVVVFDTAFRAVVDTAENLRKIKRKEKREKLWDAPERSWSQCLRRKPAS